LRSVESEGHASDSSSPGATLALDMPVGKKLNGLVTAVASFGCFVDVGIERQGLLPRSKISTEFFEDINDVVQPGQTVTVWVVENTEEKLTFTMIDESTETDLSYVESLGPGEFVEGTVVAIHDFGIFVQIPQPDGRPSIQGLVPISQMSEGFVEHPGLEVEVGQQVMVRKTKVERGKVSFSMKAAKEGALRSGTQDLSGFQDISTSTWIKGRVDGCKSFGIYVTVKDPKGGPDVVGLVHVSQIRDGFIMDPAREVQTGQEVNVRVLKVDLDTGRLNLSMKKIPS